MGLVYDKYYCVPGSPNNLLILQKCTNKQSFVYGRHLNSTNIQLNCIATSEIVYCSKAPGIPSVTLGYRDTGMQVQLLNVLCSVPVAQKSTCCFLDI